ncbi:MAG: FAD-dependent oxidoreductase [Candidatus Caldarchaeum sp.]|nr:FAD-dependent oxidoreductase [Candidatus Caldarchaeum sp.]
MLVADKFDVIVVGAGLAGSAAAIQLARSGYDVLVLEKAQLPGHRNVSGGVIFGAFQNGLGLIDLLPDFESAAPVERKITGHELYLLDAPKRTNGEISFRYLKVDKSSFLTKLGLTRLDESTGHDYTVLRVKFDKWMASRAAEEGAMILTRKTVEDLVWKDGKVVGVRTPDEEIYADLVIDCGGVTSLLPEKAGIREKLTPDKVYHGIKHVYKVPNSRIDEFFATDGGYKSVYLIGPFMHGIIGGAFLYPNRDTISVGIVVDMASMLRELTTNFGSVGKPIDLLEEMESHPFLGPLLENATLLEYSAHNIPRGYKVLPEKPYAPGFLMAGDSLGVFYKIGALIDGMRPAIASGILAAKVYAEAKARNDFSEASLSVYREYLKPLYERVSKSRTNSFLIERKIFYTKAPSVAFSLGLGKSGASKNVRNAGDNRDALQRIQILVGKLDYHEDKHRSHIIVDENKASMDLVKAWVPMCPVNCYTLVTEKGVFGSFRDLLGYNYESLRRQGLGDEAAAKKAVEITQQDIRKGLLKFDHVACVACGTCGVIGPPEMVRFGHEWSGHGVKFRYG